MLRKITLYGDDEAYSNIRGFHQKNCSCSGDGPLSFLGCLNHESGYKNGVFHIKICRTTPCNVCHVA